MQIGNLTGPYTAARTFNHNSATPPPWRRHFCGRPALAGSIPTALLLVQSAPMPTKPPLTVVANDEQPFFLIVIGRRGALAPGLQRGLGKLA
jgi:hypothetical protein